MKTVMDIDWSKTECLFALVNGDLVELFEYKPSTSNCEECWMVNTSETLYLKKAWSLIERHKPVFTQAMSDNGELPPIGSEAVLLVSKHSVASKDVDDRDGEVFDIVAHHGSAKGLAVAVSKDYMVSVTANHTWFKPIDTRTTKEKACDKIWAELDDIGKEYDLRTAMELAYDKWVGE